MVSENSDQRNFTKFVREATAAAKKLRMNNDLESRQSNPLSMPSSVHQSKKTTPNRTASSNVL